MLRVSIADTIFSFEGDHRYDAHKSIKRFWEGKNNKGLAFLKAKWAKFIGFFAKCSYDGEEEGGGEGAVAP